MSKLNTKNQKKAFTLIELLAVIVILAIIALIATPIILNIIRDSKKESEIRSTEMYLHAVDLAIMRENMEGRLSNATCSVLDGGNLDCDGTIVKVDIDNDSQIKAGGIIVIENTKIKSISNIKVGNNYYNKDENGKLVGSKNAKFVIITNLTNLTSTGSTTIETDSTSTVTLIPNEGYELPSSITVSGATSEYNNTTGVITLSNASGNVSITAEGKKAVSKLESGTAGTYGAKYSIAVNDTDTYTFYVVGENADGTTNLILERNICSDGTFATETNKCLVAWCNDAEKCKVDGSWSNSAGPLTAMAYVKQATDSWTNIPEYPEGTVYNDEGNHFTNFSYAGYRARLPFYSEVSKKGTSAQSDDSNHFLYEYLKEYTSWDTSSYGTKPTNNIDGIWGYWLFSSDSFGASHARGVNYGGYLNSTSVGNGSYFGVRPVITLKF